MNVVAVGSRASIVAAVNALVCEQGAAVEAVDIALGEGDGIKALRFFAEDAVILGVEAGAGSHLVDVMAPEGLPRDVAALLHVPASLLARSPFSGTSLLPIRQSLLLPSGENGAAVI